MELFYQEERNEDFFAVCERIREENNKKDSYESVTQIAQRAVMCEAGSFYISPNWIEKIVNSVRRGKPFTARSGAKLELYRDVEKLYKQLYAENPRIRMREIIDRISDAPAPRFYISEARAVSLYYELLGKPAKQR